MLHDAAQQNGILIALAVVVGPLLLSLLDGRQSRRKEKRLNDRQDELEQRMIDRQDRQAARTGEKLDAIHMLANGAYTAAIARDLASTEGTLAALHELAALRLRAGETPDPEAIAYVKTTEARVAELQVELKAREEAAGRARDAQEEAKRRATVWTGQERRTKEEE